ncbi:uncharacterized protein [Clytia hemisphaerica]|uniref:KN motif and ankyrin repeat domain-containing protein 1 n=1 Tax=Clytia hemisphaerica TaxID=252671 RepID=A0A7M5XBR4_9CNID
MSLERHHNNRTNNWTRDFSSLKRAKNLHNQQKVVSDIQTIAASQLFNHAGNREHKHLRRASSQPNMPPPEQKTPLVPRYPTQNTNTNHPYYQKSYWERKSSVESSSSISEDETQNFQSENFETMYDIIQQRLQRHLRREEIFSRHEIQNICRELRRRALSTELEDGWQNSLSDLEIASGMKMEVLEAIYLLRNAHKSDLFSSQESVDNTSESAMSPTMKHSSQPLISSLGRDILPNKYTHSSQPSISVTSIERTISPINDSDKTSSGNRSQRLRPSTLEIQNMQEGIQKPSPIQCKSRAIHPVPPPNHSPVAEPSTVVRFATSTSQTSPKLLYKADEYQAPNNFTNQHSYSPSTKGSPSQNSFKFSIKPEEPKTTSTPSHRQPPTPQSPINQGLIRKISPPSSKSFQKYSPSSQSAQQPDSLLSHEPLEHNLTSRPSDHEQNFPNANKAAVEQHSRVAKMPVIEVLQTKEYAVPVHQAPDRIELISKDAPRKTTHSEPPYIEEEYVTIEECSMDHEVPKDFAIPKISSSIDGSVNGSPASTPDSSTTMFSKMIRPSNLPLKNHSMTSSGEGTPTNLSSPSSGRSTPSFRKKPKRPEIKLSEHNKQYRDYIEILRAESLQSLHSEQGENGDQGAGVEISEEMIAKAFLSSHMKNELSDNFTTSTPHASNGNVESIDRLKAQRICMRRPTSPASIFLQPLLEAENSDNLLTEIYDKLVPVLNKAKQQETELDQLSTLQVKVAVLQEEKRQLAALLKEKRENSAKENSKGTRDVGVQKTLEILTEISHVSSQTAQLETSSILIGDDSPAWLDKMDKGIQQQVISTDSSCQNEPVETTDFGTETFQTVMQDCGLDPIEKQMNSVSCQKTPRTNTHHTQTAQKTFETFSSMIGCSSTALVDQGAGRDHEVSFNDNTAQTSIEQESISCQTVAMVTSSASIQVDPLPGNDFSCGVGIADLKMVDRAVEYFPEQSDACVSTEVKETRDSGVQRSPDSVSVAIGDGNVFDVICDRCSTLETRDLGTGCHVTSDTPSCIDDKLCECVKPQVCDISVGDFSISDTFCDRCDNLQTRDIGVGNILLTRHVCVGNNLQTRNMGVGNNIQTLDANVGNNLQTSDMCVGNNLLTRDFGVGNNLQTRNMGVGHNLQTQDASVGNNLQTSEIGIGDSETMTTIWCDKCTNLKTREICVGGDYDINNIVCDECNNKPATTSVAIGDYDVTDTKCEDCEKNSKRDSSYFNFDFNIENMTRDSHVQPQQQKPIICHYCGNKVDLDDDDMDETLQQMRDSMHKLSNKQSGGLKRSDARKHLNLDLLDDDRSGATYKDLTPVTPSSEEADLIRQEFKEEFSEDEDDGFEETSHDDVVQACKMLHSHFSGEKPLKQNQMMKYMGIVQALWFKTVKKRRANASVVKSYLDLFQNRIPELLETIVNLSDDEGNTALHFAFTYKNLGAASILLDSGECCVDLVNQAGYSPLMLAALVGFERKNDKYIMQRLIRMGDINKESSETGETPLMLAISRGHANMVELLLDVGCDINAVDDDGSSALMCACEHGNANIVKMLLANPDCDATVEDNEGSTALSIAMDSRRKDLALLIYGSMNFDARGQIKLSPSKQSLLGLGRRSPSPVIGRR